MNRAAFHQLQEFEEVAKMSLELDFYQMMIQPMRDELTQIGFQELRTAEQVEHALAADAGTTLVFVNSVCGCAGGIARPAAAMSLENEHRPEQLVTVFAGQDKDATVAARSHFNGNPPSSPSVWLFKDGQLVDQLHRGDIEGSSAEQVADRLKAMYNRYC